MQQHYTVKLCNQHSFTSRTLCALTVYLQQLDEFTDRWSLQSALLHVFIANLDASLYPAVSPLLSSLQPESFETSVKQTRKGKCFRVMVH
jgi:hypothetical protein